MKQKSQQSNRLNHDLFNQRIAAGVNHCLAITNTFEVVGWGSNEFENLGKPETYNQTIIAPAPVLIKLERGDQSYVAIQVAVGNAHSLILAYPTKIYENLKKDEIDPDQIFKKLSSDQMVLFSTGDNSFGQLGRQVIDKKQEEDQEDDEDEEEEDYGDDDDEGYFLVNQMVESVNNVIQIACGSNYCVALDQFGFIYTWGEGATGCLGNGSFTDVKKPQRIEFEGIRMKFITAGPAHVAVISEGGSLYTWGIGTYGQLGNGTNTSSNLPSQVSLGSILNKQIDYVSCGAMHTACVTSDGFAHTFGFNKNGQLGSGDYLDRWIPAKIDAIQNFFVCYIKCGGNTTFVCTYERMIYAFGSNSKGRLGIKDELGQNYPEPTKIDCIYFKNKQSFIYQMALSYHFGLALQENGKIISYGLPFKGCLGRDLQAELLPGALGSEQNSIDEPLKQIEEDDEGEANKLQELLQNIKPDILQQLIEPKILDEITFIPMKNQELLNKLQKEIRASQSIVEVKCGAYHTVALTDAGEVWIWGSNPFMQHGMKNNEIKEQLQTRMKYLNFTCSQTIQLETLPTQVPQFTVRENKRITYIATGFEYVVVVENRRNVYSWGKNDKGQLGIGFVSDFVEVPTKLQDLEGQLIKQIACGEDHTLVLTDEGDIKAFGSPKDGKLGIGPKQTYVLQAQQIQNLGIVNKISVGPHHSMALVVDTNYNERIIMTNATRAQESDNSEKYVIYTWGNGYGGKLGHSNQENQYYPKLLQTKYTFKGISAGTNHSGALGSDDRLIVWGIGAYLGLSKPEEDDTQQQKVRKGREIEAEPYYILAPIVHPEFQSRRYQEINLFDKYNLALNKQKKIQYWGLFDFEFQQKLKKEMEGKSDSQKERIIESILGVQNFMPQDIQFSNLSCSFNHAYAISLNQIDGVDKRDLYTWGFDGMTGRLGLGYEFQNPEKENEMQFDQGKKADIVIKQEIKDIEQVQALPVQLQFISQYLDFAYKQYMLQLEQANKQDEDEDIDQDDDDDVKSKMSGYKSKQNQEAFQLGGKGGKQISDRVMIGMRLGMVEKGAIYNKPLEQFLLESKPEIYKSAASKKNNDNDPNKKQKIKLNFFDESVTDDVYETVQAVEEQNKILYQQIKDIYMIEYKNFRDEAKLTIINKIQGEPFKVEFQKEKKESDKAKGNKKDKSPKKHALKQKQSQKNDQIPDSKEKLGDFEQFHKNNFCYKILFSILQIHPCYLINIYKNCKFNKIDYVNLVADVFGQLQNDKRKYRIYINLTINILKIDLKILAQDPHSRLNFNYEEQESSCLFTFTRLFVQFQKQFSLMVSQNLKMVDFMEQLIEKQIYQGALSKLLKNVALTYLPVHLENEFITKPKVDPSQTVKFFEERVIFIQKIFTEFLNQKLQTQYNANCEIPKPIRELLLKTYEAVKPLFLAKSITLDTIQCKLLGLYFINFQQSFMSKMEYKDQQRNNEEKAESRLVNAQCFIELFRIYINNENPEIEEPWWATLTDYFGSIGSKRQNFFGFICFGKQNTMPKTNNFTDTKKIKDIYFHSAELADDIIQPRIRSIAFATEIVCANIKKIIYIQAENQDPLLHFHKQLDKEVNYIKQKPSAEEMDERVTLKLKSRQLFYTKKSLQLRFCNECNCYAVQSFMQSEDVMIYNRFNQWNPVSLAALLIRIIPCFRNKKDFDDFISGNNPDIALQIRKKTAIQKENNLYGNILKLKEFEKAFNEKVQFNIDQSDEVTDDKKQQILKENKKVLKELLQSIQERLIQIYIYIHNMERHMAIQDSISRMLNTKISQFKTTKVLLYQKILSNCYFGMANKELIKPLEHNPVAIVSQIKDAIRKVDTSQEIYENIDVFKKDGSTPSQLKIFGSYNYKLLKDRQIIEKIDFACLEHVRKQTKQILPDEKIYDRILYITQQSRNSRNVQFIMIYSEIEFNWKQTVSCGLIKPPIEPIEFLLDIFEIETSDILSMRKAVILAATHKIQPKPKSIGKYTSFEQKGLMELVDKLTNHAVIYDHLYQEPDQKKQKKSGKM